MGSAGDAVQLRGDCDVSGTVGDCLQPARGGRGGELGVDAVLCDVFYAEHIVGVGEVGTGGRGNGGVDAVGVVFRGGLRPDVVAFE